MDITKQYLNNQQYNKQIIDAFKNKKLILTSSVNKFLNNNQNIKNYLHNIILQIPQLISEKALVFILVNNLPIKTCKLCGKFIKFTNCYRRLQYCCQSCSNKATYNGEKIKETLFKNYGVINVFQLQSVKEKCKQKHLQNLGVQYPGQSQLCKEKAKQTNLNHYGTKHPMQSNIVKNKAKQTCLQKYNVNNPAKCQEIKEKIKNTCQFIYGANSVLGNKEKRIEIQKIIKNNNYQKYGFSNHNLAKSWQNLILYSSYVLPLFSKYEWNGTHSNKKYKWKCVLCGDEFEQEIHTTNHLSNFGYLRHCPRCWKCFPQMTNTSKQEKQLLNFCKQYFNLVNENTYEIITPQELDVYIPQIKLALQFNGSYWHNIQQVPPNYHLDKSIACQKLGIRLIHVWQDEWKNNKTEIQQKLISVFNNTEIIDYSKPLDRSWYGKFTINGYQLVQKTKPEIILRNKEQVENCGYLVYKKIEK